MLASSQIMRQIFRFSRMTLEVDGDVSIANEIIQQIERWDQAIINQDINELLGQCISDVSLFDVSSQLYGIEEYKIEWEKFSPFIKGKMSISRRDAKLYVSDQLAILHCHSKVESATVQYKQKMPWCRTTLCLQQIQGRWCVIHQHISVPIDMSTGKVVILKDRVAAM